jgi:hypothetical protein
MISVLSRARSLTRVVSASVAVATLLVTAACSSPGTSAQQTPSRDGE